VILITKAKIYIGSDQLGREKEALTRNTWGEVMRLLISCFKVCNLRRIPWKIFTFDEI